MFPLTRDFAWDYQLVGFPLAMQDSQMEKLPPGVRDKTHEYLRRFPELPAGVAPVYIGRADTGKSRAAAVIALAFKSINVGTEWVSCPSQFPEVDRTKFTDNAQAIIRRWKRISMLVLDDFLLASAHLLPEIVWAREAAQLPTVFTGNLFADSGQEWGEISKLYGAAGAGIVHRLQTLSGGFGLFTS